MQIVFMFNDLQFQTERGHVVIGEAVGLFERASTKPVEESKNVAVLLNPQSYVRSLDGAIMREVAPHEYVTTGNYVR